MKTPAEQTDLEFEYNQDGSIRSITGTIKTDRVKSKLIAQGMHPEVAEFVEENFQALNSLEIEEGRINKRFDFDGEKITEATAKKISVLRKYLKPNESLSYTFDSSSPNFISNRFKIE